MGCGLGLGCGGLRPGTVGWGKGVGGVGWGKGVWGSDQELWAGVRVWGAQIRNCGLG